MRPASTFSIIQLSNSRAEIFFDFHCSLLISACFFLFYKESEKKERDMEENEKRNVSLLFLKALI